MNYSTSAGFSIAAEAVFTLLPLIQVIQVGGGVEYQFQRSITTGNFQYVPLYGMVRVPFTLGSITPYAVARFGYGIWSGDTNYSGGLPLTSGLYFSMGGGVDYRLGPVAIFAEAAFSTDNGSIALAGYTENVNYTRLDVSLGVSLPF